MNALDPTSIVEIQTPAKLNLFLEISGKRADGFHELETFMVAVNLFDTICLSKSPFTGYSNSPTRDEPHTKGSTELECRWTTANEVHAGHDGIGTGHHPELTRGDLPEGRDNLAVVAAERLREAAGIENSISIRIHKRIPSAAGLGGASSDAAAVLWAANRLWRLNWPGAKLSAVAAEIGSDVPFFVGPFVAARVGGRGERLTAAAAPHCGALLVNPGVPVSAADAYRWLERPGGALPLAGWSATGCAVVQDALRNDLQPGVAVRTPEVPAALTALARLELGPVAMSGSGATCYALSGDLEALAAGAEALAAERTRWWIRTVAFAADRLSR